MGNMFEIIVEITTKSGCLIGNQTSSFSIGGVDQMTTVDEKGYPIIHGSAFKGAFRNIIRENQWQQGYMENTSKYLDELFKSILEKYNKIPDKEKNEKLKKLISNIEKYNEKDNKKVKQEYIFGVEGINNMPRLYFTDFRVKYKRKSIEEFFLIDTKTSITVDEKNNEIMSNPRTYKIIKPGITFEGKIRFNDNYFLGEKVSLNEIKNEIEEELLKFNKGIYGIGNSKSRGYGEIMVEVKQGKEND